MAHIVIDARIRRASTGRPVDRLLEHLQDLDRQNRYTILVQPDDPWKPHSPAFTTLPCPYPQFSFNPFHELGFAWQLYKLKPDLVHFTMTQQPLLYFGKIVTMTHDLTMFHFVRRGSTPLLVFWLKMRLYHLMFWWSHKKSTKIIVPTKTVAKELSNFEPFTKNKIVVTYEAAGFDQSIQAQKPKGVDGDFIMYLGNGFPHKNLYRLIEAFDILHPKYPKLKLVLVGKKEKNYEELEQWAQSRPSYKNIIFYGFAPDGEAKWMHRRSRAFVQPSLMEGWGIPVLEAMANGAPAVSSSASVMPEVYGNAALYFDPYNPKDMADKLSKVLDDPKLRQQLIDAGHKQVKKYSWQKMAKQTLQVYTDVLSR